MILLPYVHTITSVNQIPVHSYTILTIGGKALWTEELNVPYIEAAEQTLIDNELYTDVIHILNHVCLCRIDTEKTQMTDFYKWNEITDDDTFCWRTLYTFGEKQNWLPHPTGTIGGISYQSICNMIYDVVCSQSKPYSLYIK